MTYGEKKLGVSPKLATVAGFDDLHYEWSAKGPAAAQATMDLQWEISMVICDLLGIFDG